MKLEMTIYFLKLQNQQIERTKKPASRSSWPLISVVIQIPSCTARAE